MSEQPSYRDVVAFVNDQRYRIADNYAWELTCTKAGGWNLWHTWEGKHTLLGGEYNGEDFRIEVRGQVICQSAPSTAEAPQAAPPPQEGWTGDVWREPPA